MSRNLILPIGDATIPYPPKGKSSPIGKEYVDTLEGMGQGDLNNYQWYPIDLPYRQDFIWTNTYGRVVYMAGMGDGGSASGAGCGAQAWKVVLDEDGEEISARLIFRSVIRNNDASIAMISPVGSDEVIRLHVSGLASLPHRGTSSGRRLYG